MLFLSVVSLGELRKGATQLEKSIETQAPNWFEARILPVTRANAERWGELDGTRQMVGHPLNAPDGMIAATALEHGWNNNDRTGRLPCLAPWSGRRGSREVSIL